MAEDSSGANEPPRCADPAAHKGHLRFTFKTGSREVRRQLRRHREPRTLADKFIAADQQRANRRKLGRRGISGVVMSLRTGRSGVLTARSGDPLLSMVDSPCSRLGRAAPAHDFGEARAFSRFSFTGSPKLPALGLYLHSPSRVM